MPRPRLMQVVVTPPVQPKGLFVDEVFKKGLQQRLQLDAPPQLIFQKVQSDAQTPPPFTSLVFRYTPGFADTAAYNEGVADVEGEIIDKVKNLLGVDEVFYATEKVDWKRG